MTKVSIRSHTTFEYVGDRVRCTASFTDVVGEGETEQDAWTAFSDGLMEDLRSSMASRDRVAEFMRTVEEPAGEAPQE